MKFKTKALLLTSLIFFFTIFSIYPHSSSEQTGPSTDPQASTQSSMSRRTIAFKWYSFFDVPIRPDVWEARYGSYGTDKLVSSTYPVVYIWEPETGWRYYYTSARLNVAARELPEITVDHPEFLPYNLTGKLPPSVKGGTVQIKNWYLEYLNTSRAAVLVNKYTGMPFLDSPYYDGYITELFGNIVMDKNATMKILGITDAQYNNIQSWWTTNNGTVKSAWSSWLWTEANTRFDIRPFFEWPLVDHTPVYIPEPIKLSYNSVLDQVTLTIDFLTGGMECLLAKWFKETFMPGYEWWWDDFKFNAIIGPSTTNLDIDAAVTWAMYMWSYNDTAFAEPTWAFESVWGDIPAAAASYNTSSPGYVYYGKKYYIVAPGHDWYNSTGDFDYTPAAWNLKEGETLSFDWSNVYEKGPVWVYKQLRWNPATEKPKDKMENITGFIKLSETSEPYPAWGKFRGQVVHDPAAKTLTYIGPINMTDLSWNNIRKEWTALADPDHPNGLLPYGAPWVEFKLVRSIEHDVAITSVIPSVTRPYQGQIVDVSVVAVNIGTNTETFDVTAKYDNTIIGTETVTSLPPGQSTTLTFNWNTSDLTPGVDYTLKAEASTVPGEQDTADNVFVSDIVVRIPEEHDIAITSVVAFPTVVNPGQNVTIRVVVSNDGYSIETFDVTAFYNETSIGPQHLENLDPGATKTLDFVWNTIGVALGKYTIKAVASSAPGETDLADNTKVDGVVQVKAPTVHNVAVTSVTVSATTVNVGDVITITVIVKNTGTEAETFTVRVDGNVTTLIGTKSVVNLALGAEKTLEFTWNTTGVLAGKYSIRAVATTVPGESNAFDNTRTGPTITLKQPEQPTGTSWPPMELVTIAAVILIAVVAVPAIYILTRKK